MGVLYIVGTPIGNLGDLSPRAARVLGQVGLVAAEDTRVSRKLLSHLGVRPRVLSFHQHNYQERLGQVLKELESTDVALVTDAGMPGVSDPGSELVAAAAAAGVSVQVVPGPSAVTTALAVSGFGGGAFHFLGFLPRRRRDRLSALAEVRHSQTTLAIFEAPHRVRAVLEDLDTVLGDRPLAVCRELTKLHEEVFRGTAAQALEHFAAPRGEFVLVIEGADPDSALAENASGEDQVLAEVTRHLSELKSSGVRAKDAVAQAAMSSGLPKNRVYQLWLKIGRPPEAGA